MAHQHRDNLAVALIDSASAEHMACGDEKKASGVYHKKATKSRMVYKASANR